MPDALFANKSRFVFKIGETQLGVVGFVASESLFSTFEIGLDLASKEDLTFDDLVGQTGGLAIYGPGGTRYIHGLVSRLDMIEMKGDFRLYHAIVVPTVWMLDLTKDNRIFQNLSVPKIIDNVLQDAGITEDHFDQRLRANYIDREYCVQYNETNLDFIKRLLEEEGIFFFFEHEQDKHLMVFGDDPLSYQPIDQEAEVLYNPSQGMVSDEEYVYQFEFSRAVHTGKLSLRDFYFEKPDLDLSADSQGDFHSNLEIYQYPGGYVEKSLGKYRAKVYLEEAMVYREQTTGRSNCPRLMPGKTFQLKTDSTQPEMTKKYLIVAVRHQGRQPQVLEQFADPKESFQYNNAFVAIPASVPFRPARKTVKPSVQGVQSAIVTGPGGEEVHTDKYGRVKVQFHWDRQGKKDDKSSCWVRVSQAWAGAGWGAMYIPRIGQEVLVDFLDGDPDRPIITARVYHGNNMPPYALPGDKTKSTIKSNSSPGGGGSNELRFEDKKGSEEVYLHGQKDWNTLIENDQNTVIGNNKTIQVGVNHTESIGGNMHLTVRSNTTEIVAVNKSETIGVAKELTIGAAYQVSVGAAMNESIGGAKGQEIGGVKAEVVGAHRTVTVGKNASESIGGNKTVNIAKDFNKNIGGELSEKIKKDYLVASEKKITLKAKDEISIEVGKAKLVMKKNGDILLEGKNITQKGSGKINIKASGDVIIKGSKIKEN